MPESNPMDRIFGNMSEDAARRFMDRLEPEQIQQAIKWVVDESIVPHLTEIRENSKGYPPSVSVREYYNSMSPEEREQTFYDTVNNLVGALGVCRERPSEGWDELKQYLRDPYTVEALLLIFDGEDPETGERYIDPSYEDQLKDFGAAYIRWAGVMVLPEIYTEGEIQETLEEFGIDPPIDGEESGGPPG